MKSLDGEVVPLKRPVTITPEVEVSVTPVVLGDSYANQLISVILCFVPKKFCRTLGGAPNDLKMKVPRDFVVKGIFRSNGNWK